MTATSLGTLDGRDAPVQPRSPFGPVAPAVAVAVVSALAALVWIAFGGGLPGGRWFAVHLFTLGVLSNLVLSLTQHFAVTLTRAPSPPSNAPLWVFDAGAVLVLVGIPTQTEWAVAVGAVIATAAVFESYRRLRRLRRGALGARFAWIVRAYERAHGAFLHGAVLGLLLGVGWLSGRWYGAVRTAHLHINVLGWGGLTLLATMVFFGPTLVRRRIEPGADDRAARALRLGATGLTVGVLALLATGVGGDAGTVLRWLAAAGLAVFAWAGTVVCLPAARVAARRDASAIRWSVLATSVWLPLVLWADVVAVARGWWGWLDPLGVMMLVGVLLQAITATLTHLGPLLLGRGRDGRDRVRSALERAAGPRALAHNLAVLAVTVAAWAGRDLGQVGAVLARVGWAVVGAGVVYTVVAAVVAATPIRPARWQADPLEGDLRPSTSRISSGTLAPTEQKPDEQEPDMSLPTLAELGLDECLELIGSRGVGRLAVDDGQGPVILPTDYVFQGGVVHIRTGHGTKLDAADRRAPAAFEVDALDAERGIGWSVLLRGRLKRLVAPEPGTVDEPVPSAPGDRDQLIGLLPTRITGRRLGPRGALVGAAPTHDLGNVWHGRDGDDLLA